ncbi:MAG: hypothetical protein JXA00_03900 [Candidatus Thermoplasmatota archaeon]|nr:hypothetical protein [Candidatus Thermoplasmatota archaeon]
MMVLCTSSSPLIGHVLQGRSSLLSAPSSSTRCAGEDSGSDLPTWYPGDEWVSTITPLSYSSPNASFSGTISNFKQQVVSRTQDAYEVALTGSISGALTIEGVTGQLSGDITGTSFTRLSDLAEVSTELHSQGVIQVVIIPIPYSLDLYMSSSPPVEVFDFPLSIGEEWQLLSTSSLSGAFTIEGVYSQTFNETQWIDELIACTEKEAVVVPAGTFESYKVTRPNVTVWYAPDAEHIVKTMVEYTDGDTAFSMTLSLQSVTRNPQPITVSEEIVPTYAAPNATIVISGMAINTATGAPLQNAAVTMAIPSAGQSYSTSTDVTGFYTKTMAAPLLSDDTPSGRETGSGGVVVTCTGGGFSGYQVQTLVTMQDTSPTAPSITGPSQGKVNVEYDYTVVATDAQDDAVFYYIDWGDTTNSGWLGPYDAGASIAVSHTFTKKGTYTITAMARDVYHAEGPWGSLDVTMPHRVVSRVTERFSSHHPHMFFLFQQLLRLIEQA